MAPATGRSLQQLTRDDGSGGPPAQDAAQLSEPPGARGGLTVRNVLRDGIGASLPQQGAAWSPHPPSAPGELAVKHTRRHCEDGGAARSLPPPGARAELVIKNTFYHCEAADADLSQTLRRTLSAPALAPPPPRRGPAAVSSRGHRRAACPSPGPPEALGAGEWRTSVLLRNVPYLLSRDALLELLDSQGFSGQYDLVYLPRDFATKQTLGYAFVNTLNPSVALRLRSVFDGFWSWPVKSTKTCGVGWCDRQGLSENIQFFRNSRVVLGNFPEDFKPMLFSKDGQIPFPDPTRKVKTPKRQH